MGGRLTSTFCSTACKEAQLIGLNGMAERDAKMGWVCRMDPADNVQKRRDFQKMDQEYGSADFYSRTNLTSAQLISGSRLTPELVGCFCA